MDEPTRLVAQSGAEDAQHRLLALLDRERGAVEPSAPSRLPGWTVGHVLTHLARNADSMFRVLDGLAAGADAVERYPAGSRDAEIDAGAARPTAVLIDDVRTSATRLHARWDGFERWDGRSIETSGSSIAVSELPMMRWREVEVHTVDLGLGAEPAEWPGLFVRLELRAMEMRWRARRPMGMTGLPPAALALDPPTRLAWLYGRVEIPDLPPAGLL